MHRHAAEERRNPEASDDGHRGPLTEFKIPVTGGEVITILSDVGSHFGGTCGSSLWAGSTALVAWLGKQPQFNHLYFGRAVLELGAGLGLVGLALDKMGAARVLLTDLPRQLPLLQHNRLANLPARGAVGCCALSWGEPLPQSVRDSSWDLVVAADVVYEREWVEPLAATIAALLSQYPEAMAVLALPDRADFSEESPPFLEEGARNGRFKTGDGSPRGSRRRPTPDYELLFSALRSPRCGGLCVTRIGTVSSAEARTCESEVHVFLVCRRLPTSQTA